MEHIPLFTGIFFALTTFTTIGIFYKATQNSKVTLTILLCWVGLQAIVGSSGFYASSTSTPPRFILLLLPPLLVIIVLFTTPGGRRYIDAMDIKTLTLLHIVRIAVELTLYWLFLFKYIPRLMTFEGRNLDILAGLSAPVIYYYGFAKKSMSKNALLIWNFICLGLLINIVVNAILSAPLPFQQFGFDQPDLAILYFPFVWLPCCIVPLVLLAHLVAIRKLTRPATI